MPMVYTVIRPLYFSQKGHIIESILTIINHIMNHYSNTIDHINHHWPYSSVTFLEKHI